MRFHTEGLSIGFVGATMFAATAAADGTVLFAPYVVFESGQQAEIELADSAGRGALVRLHFLDRSGSPIQHGGHPIVVTRAIPPGEALTVNLGAFWSAAFEGALRLEASHVVDGTVALPAVRYPLVPSARAIDCAWGLAPGDRVLIAVQNAEASAVVIAQEGPASAPTARTCAPFASYVETLSGREVAPGSQRLHANGEIAVVVLLPGAATPWAIGETKILTESK